MFTHQFLLMPECSIPPLGWDLLQPMHATIHVGAPQANLLAQISGSLFQSQDLVQLITPNISSQVDPRV